MSSSKPDSSFVPKKNITTHVGKDTVHVYPDLTPAMCVSEKSYGFTVTKNALEAVEVPFRAKLQVLAGSTSTTPLSTILQAQFITHANDYSKRLGHFNVLSYHGRNGLIINNATLDNGNLRPLENATNATRRPPGLMYAKIEVDLTFSAIDPANTAIYPFSFFIRLYVEARDVLNSTGQVVHLTTFHGDDDWTTSYDQARLNSDIWNHSRSLVYPFNLKPPEITDIHADAVIVRSSNSLEKLALEASWQTITGKIFKQICPNITQDPAAVIQTIRQSSVIEGKTVSLTVEEFFNAIQRMTAFFTTPNDVPWAIDVTQHFLTHCDEDIRSEMHANKFVHNSATASRLPHHQLENLQNAYSEAITAELKNDRLRTIARSEVSSHAFHIGVNSGSVAEKTMERYAGAGKSQPNPCWGCGDMDHAYATKGGGVTCPNKDKPGVEEKATLARKEYNARLKKKRKESDQKKRSHGSTFNTNALNGLNADVISRLSGDQLKALLTIKTDDIGSDSDKKSKNSSKSVSFCVEVACLTSTNNSKPILPITIDVNLPHVLLAIGQSITGPQFTLSAAYDTCAALCVGHLGFHLAIAQELPHLVKSLIWAKDEYTPITLSGIVSDSSDKKATKPIPAMKPTSILPAIIEYHMPYKSREGYQTSLKIALGDNVSVNTIIGLSMIRPAKFSLDLSDDVMEPGVLDTEPFPVIYKPTIRSMPDFSNVDEAAIKSLHSSSNSISVETVRQCRNDLEFADNFEVEELLSAKSTDNIQVEVASDCNAVPEYPSMSIV
jgi:hypothetical protein